MPNLVKHGDFSSSEHWTSSLWTINTSNRYAEAYETDNLSQDLPDIKPGKKLRVSYSVILADFGDVTVWVGGTTGTTRSAVGDYVEYLIPVNTTGIVFKSYIASSLRITNVDVRECNPSNSLG